jgi:hypothetical protein
MILRKIGMLNKFNKLMLPKRYFSFGGSEKIASARSKLSKLERTKAMANSPNASGLSSDLNTHDKGKDYQKAADVAVQSRETNNDIDVSEVESKKLFNYIDGDQALQNDMRTINYRSKQLFSYPM